MNRSCYLWSNKHTSCHAISETTYEQKHTSSFNNEQKLPSLVKQTYKLVPGFFAVHSKYGNYYFTTYITIERLQEMYNWISKLIFTYYQNGLHAWLCHGWIIFDAFLWVVVPIICTTISVVIFVALFITGLIFGWCSSSRSLWI